MKVLRSINNNIVTAVDENGIEIIVIGKGIGYKAEPGSYITPDKIIKKYRMETQDNDNRISEQSVSFPYEYIELSVDILEHAQEKLQKNLYERTFITLADHIYFAVQRHNYGVIFRNALTDSVRRFYTPEYEVGLYALDLIEKRLKIRLVPCEAASIAMYLVNAEYDASVRDTFEATTIINEIVEIIEKKTGCHVIDENEYGDCFLSYLKYLAFRVINKAVNKEENSSLNKVISELLAHEMNYVEEIIIHVKEKFDHKIPADEKAYLALHINKLSMAGKN